MITWTITEGVKHPEVPDTLWWQVNGDDEDPHDPRHFVSRHQALEFLLTHRMKLGHTLRLDGPDTGTILRIGLVLDGDAIHFDCGTVTLAHVSDLVDWLDATLKPGDTVVYPPGLATGTVRVPTSP